MDERTQNTIRFLSGRPDLFDRITKDGKGGRVRWGGSKPVGYNGRICLPWGDVKGRYWYPWPKGQGSNYDPTD